MLLSEAIRGYILAKSADGVSSATVSVYHYGLGKLLTFTGDVDVGNLDTPTVRAFFVWLRSQSTPIGSPLSVSTLQQVYRTIKTFLAWCENELRIPHVDMVARPQGEGRLIQPFSESDVRKLLHAAEFITTNTTAKRKSYSQRRPSSLRNVAIVLTLLDTGLRLGELSRLDVGDYDERDGTLSVLPFGSSVKSRPRIVPLGKSARRALWKYTAARGQGEKNDPLFTTQDGKRMSVDWLVNFFIRLGKRAEIPHCHGHRFRHTFAIEFLRNGGDVFTLQRLLGHRSLEMTKLYLDIVQTDLEAAGAFRLGDKPLAHNLKQKQGSPTLYPVDQVELARFADRDRRTCADLLAQLVPNAQRSQAAHRRASPVDHWRL
jgi:integrase/recombinase XerD